MPAESLPDERRACADEDVRRVGEVEGVETVGAMSGNVSIMGAGMLSMSGGASGGATLDSFTVYVILDRSADMEQITDDIKESLEGIDASFEVTSSGMDASALGDSGITVNLFSDSLEDMLSASETIVKRVEGIAGVAEIDDGFEEPLAVLRLAVDRDAAATHGLTTAQVYQQVGAALTKEQSATEVTWDLEGYSVVLVNEPASDEQLTPDYLKELEFSVTARDGSVERVKLSDVATFSESRTLPSVQRLEQRRVLPVAIEVDTDHNVTLVTQEVERALATLELPTSVSYEVTGENTMIMEAFNELGLMLVLGLLLVYLIMVAQFQSLKSPFIIMFTVPLAFTGGFLALLLTGKVLSVISLIGFAMLVGIIVSNAIVLVDYINRLRREGTERVNAIREAAAIRMRPILMTALTTIFALIMMALGIGNGSEMMQPLAIVCIGGLTYGTFMTLFVIPIIYDLLNRKELRVISDADLATIDE
jgi:multidrug efflux pump subunit AcrB